MPRELIEILESCERVGRGAREVYRTLSSREREVGLKRLWDDMADAEEGFVAFWVRLRSLAEKGSVPAIFDRPARVRADLAGVLDQVRELGALSGRAESITEAFLIALRLEYHLVHPALAALLIQLGQLEEDADPASRYEGHLRELRQRMRESGAAAPELDLLGDAIARIWKLNRELLEQSDEDRLCGVLNGRGLGKIMLPLAHLAGRRSDPVAVLVFDLDFFKEWNDSRGHAAGDAALGAAGEALRARLRGSDVVARTGGDEFVVFLSSVRARAAEDIARDLRQRVAEDCGLTLSCGGHVAVLGPDVEAELARVQHAADQNLMEVKRRGGDSLIVTGC